MPHFLLTGMLKNAIAKAIKNNHAEKADPYSESRRQFLRNTAIATGGSLLLPEFLQAQKSENNP